MNLIQCDLIKNGKDVKVSRCVMSEATEKVVREALADFRAGKLKEAESVNELIKSL